MTGRLLFTLRQPGHPVTGLLLPLLFTTAVDVSALSGKQRAFCSGYSSVAIGESPAMAFFFI